MHLLTALQDFFQPRLNSVQPDSIVVAFSGGPDSCALLWGLQQLQARHLQARHLQTKQHSQLRDTPLPPFRLYAAHLDHRLDLDSRRRAHAAQQLAQQIDVPLITGCLPENGPPQGESLESYARRRRYAFLEHHAKRLGARFIATAHHADDQAETVLLRLLFGSGLAGLAAIRPQEGKIVRPLLSLTRPQILQTLAESGFQPVEDPTNQNFQTPRNRIRHHTLPLLQKKEPRLEKNLVRIAAASRQASTVIDDLLETRLDLQILEDGVAIARQAFAQLPEPLYPFALSLLHRRAGNPYPASAAARSELLRQLRHGHRTGCDCGDGWRWQGDKKWISLVRVKPSVGNFAYNLEVPGGIEIPELALSIHFERGSVAPWMFRGHHDRAGLAFPVSPGIRVTVRNRRPGDRIRPLGCSHHKRLKDLLIDRRVPQQQRERLPLLIIGGEMAWVPGVSIGEAFRLTDERTAWIVAIEKHHQPLENPLSAVNADNL